MCAYQDLHITVCGCDRQKDMPCRPDMMTSVMSCRSLYQSIGSLNTRTALKGASSVPQLGSAMSGITFPSGVRPAYSHVIGRLILLQIKHSIAALNPYSCSQVLQTYAESTLLGTEQGMNKKVAIVQMNSVTQSELHESCIAPDCESELLLYRHRSQGTHTVQYRS